jgi:predicted DNA-binding transcriptional regulator AlpA
MMTVDVFMRKWSEASPQVRAHLERVLAEGKCPDGATRQPARLLSARAAADRLGLCVKSVLRLRDSGKLPGVCITGSIKSLRFRETDVEALVDSAGVGGKQ